MYKCRHIGVISACFAFLFAASKVFPVHRLVEVLEYPFVKTSQCVALQLCVQTWDLCSMITSDRMVNSVDHSVYVDAILGRLMRTNEAICVCVKERLRMPIEDIEYMQTVMTTISEHIKRMQYLDEGSEKLLFQYVQIAEDLIAQVSPAIE